MHPSTLRITPCVLAFGCGAALLGCGNFSDDGERYTKLDRLRVLAVRSTPADLVPGESATLDALVFQPGEDDLEFEWSWCPSRDSETFECNIAERDLRSAWAKTGSASELPRYDLGSASEASFPHMFTQELVLALCGALSTDAADAEQATLACLGELQVSVRLTVRSKNDEVTAVKDLVLLGTEPSPEQRNTNPALPDKLAVRDLAGGSALDADDALRAGHTYALSVDLDESTAERFLPAVTPSDPEPKKRRETLVMTWFMTIGSEANPDGEGDFDDIGDRQRTTFVDGHSDFDTLTRNGWKLPLTAGPEPADFFLVLRDERGGVGWLGHRFAVKESK